MRAALRTLAAAAVLLLARSSGAAAASPVRAVPVEETALASMLLLAYGAASPVLLFDAQEPDSMRRAMAEAGAPVECFVRPGTTASVRALLESTTGTACTVVGDLPAFARRAWPAARAVVLAPVASYDGLLRAAALAGGVGAALVPVTAEPSSVAAALDGWTLDTVYVLPGLARPKHTQAHLVFLKSNESASKATVRRMRTPPRMIVIANPHDRDGVFSQPSLSLLAPLIATTHNAALVLVSDAAPDTVEREVRQFIDTMQLAPTHMYLVGDELALNSHRVPDPVLQAGGPEAIGGGRDVRVELFSEIQNGQPQDYAVGRFVAEDAARGSAMLARQLHRGLATGEQVTLLSNADEEFELGETIARTTVSELRNAGLRVRAEYRDAVTPAVIQDALQSAGVLVWEGHARDLTLEEHGSVAVERTPPLVVLQGCYTLERSDPFILFERGTQAIVATSAAIYSASGASFARALFDNLLYAQADLGTAVRNARNYLLAVTELKKRRKHSDWPKTYRAALAFTLWGDPSARPALPVQPPKLAPVEWRADDGVLQLTVPKQHLKTAAVGRYSVQPVPRAMLSGLILRDGDNPERQVKELFYDALSAPPNVTAACPPARGWDVVSLFAPRTRTLSVLARPEGDTPNADTASGDYRLPLVADASRCPPIAAKAP